MNFELNPFNLNIQSIDYAHQYSHIYYNRLLQLKRHYTLNFTRIVDLIQSQQSHIIGCIYKHQPSTLHQLTQLHSLDPIPLPNISTDSVDTFYIEDESARIQLSLSPDLCNSIDIVTGNVLVLHGYEENGLFHGISIYPLTLLPHPSPSIATINANADSSPSSICFLSGISTCSPLVLDLLFDFISTQLKPSLTVLLGNSYTLTLSTLPLTSTFVVLPGSTDPTLQLLPQQALHSKLFTCSPTLTTNPSLLHFSTLSVLLTSGSNVISTRISKPNLSELDIACRMLYWKHIAPSAPNNLSCYPLADSDCFVLDSTPHVYAVGNTCTFDTRLVKEGDVCCRVVCVPDYSKTAEIVLMDAVSREVEVIRFEINLK